MRRWVTCSLLLCMGCLREQESLNLVPPCEPAPSAQALPGEELAQAAVALNAADAEGRRPMLVTFRRGYVSAAATALETEGVRLAQTFPRLGVAVARLTPEERARLERHPLVAHVEEDRPLYATGLWRPDTVTAQSLVQGEVPWGVAAVQAPEVWDADGDGVLDPSAPTGRGVRVCVLDSGIDRQHPELQAAYAGGHDFVDDDDDPDDSSPAAGFTRMRGTGHGTHVAGTIAARVGAGGRVLPDMTTGGVVGVAPEVELLVARVLNTRGIGSTRVALSALDWCLKNGARIVSMSLGAPESSEAERTAIEAALAAGMLVVAASGNDGEGAKGLAYPAAYPGVLAVGAVDVSLQVAPFSQRGEGLGVVAPGVDVLSPVMLGDGASSRLEVGRATFVSNPLLHASAGSYSGRVVDCGLGEHYRSCGEQATCDGFVAFVRRGGRTFSEKAEHVMGQGARAVIFGNNDPDEGVGRFTLGTARSNPPWVPAVSVSLGDSGALQSTPGALATVEVLPADYRPLDGTSMATPHVSAAAALVWGVRPDLTARQVQALLKATAKDLGEQGPDRTYGAGLVQVRAALERLEAGPLPPEWDSGP